MVPLLRPNVPALLAVRVNLCRVNVAVTNLAALMVTVQVLPETESHPLQLLRLDPVAGAAVSVTTVPLS
jgi:hypothetical protein